MSIASGGAEFLTLKKKTERLRFADGQMVSVQWPDGSVSDVPIRLVKYVDGDMAWHMPFMDVVLRGLKVEIPLKDVLVYVNKEGVPCLKR